MVHHTIEVDGEISHAHWAKCSPTSEGLSFLVFVSTSFYQTCLGFEFRFWLIGLELSLVEIWKSTNSPTPYLKFVLLVKTG
jgi:hypothetical protein